jgi:hypothetical protein
MYDVRACSKIDVHCTICAINDVNGQVGMQALFPEWRILAQNEKDTTFDT